MSEMIKFGGRTDAGLAKAVRVTEDGNVATEREWSAVMVEAVNVEIRDTAVLDKSNEKVDVSKYGIVSLRINNTHDQNIEVHFYDDVQEKGGSWLSDIDGTFYKLTIPAKAAKMIVVTPDDLPFLNYAQKIGFRINAVAAPTTGTLKIWVAAKG